MATSKGEALRRPTLAERRAGAAPTRSDEQAPVILGTVHFVCNSCCKPAPMVVAFVARSVRDGKPVWNRGGARTVRLCRGCTTELSKAWRGRAARRRRT